MSNVIIPVQTAVFICTVVDAPGRWGRKGVGVVWRRGLGWGTVWLWIFEIRTGMKFEPPSLQ